MKVRVGVIGVGFIGKVHIEQLRRLGNVDVVALVNIEQAQDLADQLMVEKGYSDYKQMIDCQKPDVVHICTPNNTHFEMAMYAMERGIHVVCEKPMAMTYEQAYKMADYARQKNLIGGVNYHCRFYPMIYQMKKMVEAGQLGKVYSIHGGYLQDWLYYPTDYNWRLVSQESGLSRAFSDIGSHWLDSVQFITGLEVDQVLADFATFYPTRKKPRQEVNAFAQAGDDVEYQDVPIDTEDYATVLLRMKGGAKVSCNISQMFAGKKNQMKIAIAGSRCSYIWDSEEINKVWIGYRDKPNAELVKDYGLLDPATGCAVSYPGGHIEGFGDAFKHNFRQIYEHITTGKAGDYATFEDGAKSLRLIDKMIDSATKGGWVEV